jgi:hypothetical protein
MKNRKLERLVIQMMMLVVGALMVVSHAHASPVEEEIIHTFTSVPDGDSPVTGLVSDAAGNLYGTTLAGGNDRCCLGTVFELSPPTTAGGAWVETILYRFRGDTDGSGPSGTLIFDKLGNLYGVTLGGPNLSNTGTVFELSPPATAGGEWTETPLLVFPADGSKGQWPRGKLAVDGAGNLYGATQYGGNDPSCNCGVAFQLKAPATAGGPWTENVLYNFGAVLNDGQAPVNGVIFRAGAIYGAAAAGGPTGDGSIFQLVQKNGVWSENTLYSFTGLNQGGGSDPGGVIFDAAGNLYGTTFSGGKAQCRCGMIYELSPPSVTGNPWQETTLYSFTGHADGANPAAPLWRDKTGNLYGTAVEGSLRGNGTAFKLKAPALSGGTWKLAVLHDFGVLSATDGTTPESELIHLPGALYGTTSAGGSGSGTVFRLVF